MRNVTIGLLLFVMVAMAGCESPLRAASLPADAFTRESDVIYHKEGGFALTLERIAPAQNANGASIVMVISGGWISSHDHTKPHGVGQLPRIFQPNAMELLRRGYTLFYVVHGSQPKFTIREIDAQLGAAIRYIRYNAGSHGLDPDRIGIMGSSAGGHLSLMRGTKGADGVPQAMAPADTSSRVQAVVAYFPPTDFLNYGSDGVFFDKVVREVIPQGQNPFLQALDYLEFDEVEIRLNKVTDATKLAKHYRYVAPVYHVTQDDAPTLILHGNVDRLVPLQQSELIVDRFIEQSVAHQLYVKDGGDHGWEATDEEVQMVADWFDLYLAPATPE